MNRYEKKDMLIRVINKNLDATLSSLSDAELNDLIIEECTACLARATERASKWKDSGDSGACFDYEGGFISRKLLEEVNGNL